MIKISKDVVIHPTAEISAFDGVIGPRTIIGPYASIKGTYVEIGPESWIGEYASIGGGSCYDPQAHLKTGAWFHLGPQAHINIARGVTIGDEVGIGWRSSVFTHGAYLPATDGFPVQWEGVIIGNRVWIPNAWVNPGVHIWNDVVVAAMSLVNSDIQSGCLAGGIPAKVIKANAYPQHLTSGEIQHILLQTLFEAEKIADFKPNTSVSEQHIVIADDAKVTIFDIRNRKISGTVTGFSETLKNQLRRNGIRFRYYAKDREYVKWEE